MSQNWILYPIIAMVLLTLYVGLRMLALRIKAVREDKLSPAYFLLNRGGKPPEYLAKMTQHYDNLFELPILFYMVVTLIFVMEKADYGYLALAWLYFLTRMVHMIIHTGYNNIHHRKNVFLLSVIVLYAIWGRLLTQLLTT